MLSKSIMQEYKRDMKQFKTTTGSPITYAKLRKQKGMYYPLARPHLVSKKGKLNHHHVAVVYSKMYGREVYENVDIWPDDQGFLKDKNAVVRLYNNIGDIPDTLEESESEVEEEVVEEESSGDVHTAPPGVHPHHAPDDKKPEKHVTIKITEASDDDDRSSSGDTAELSRPDSPSSSQHSGQWPLKRSQSIDSRDNPFLPGGDLRKEAEDILSRATIIRDTFTLRDGTVATSPASPEKQTARPANGSPVTQGEQPVTETMTTQVVKSTEASAVPNSGSTETRHKENGQVDTDNSLTPGSVKVDIAEDFKDRKKQKKCCSVM